MVPAPSSSSPSSLRVAGLLLAIGAVGFVAVFSALAASFGYPDVLDRASSEVLPALIAGGSTLKAWWIVYAILPLTLSAAALLAHGHLARLGDRARLFTAAGVAAGLAMTLGLLRWPTLEWSLGASWLAADGAARGMIEAVADASHRLLGNALGEVAGESLLGLWLLGAALAVRAAARAATPGASLRWWPRLVSLTTLTLGTAMLVGAWRFVWPALEAVTAVTNLVLPVGLIVLGVAWAASPKVLATIAAVVPLVALTPSGRAAEAEPMATREVIVHGFRAPSMGVELRERWLGFHVGLYPTIIDTNAEGEARTTWFLKTGVTFYPFQFDTGSGRPSGPYAGVALVQGLGGAWDVAASATKGSGGFFDLGFRWAAFEGLDLRVGLGALVSFDGRAELNFTPGISWGIPL